MSGPDENAGNSTETEVEIFVRVNRLKEKAGSHAEGPAIQFSSDKTARAQNFIDKKAQDYEKHIDMVLRDIEKAWGQALSDKTDIARAGRETMYHKAHHAKDLAATCDYPLMQHFSQSLRDFVERLEPKSKEHQIIVRAHLDAMRTVRKENIKDQGGEKAQQLKKLIEIAISTHLPDMDE